jgi:hypothetical protein
MWVTMLFAGTKAGKRFEMVGKRSVARTVRSQVPMAGGHRRHNTMHKSLDYPVRPTLNGKTTIRMVAGARAGGKYAAFELHMLDAGDIDVHAQSVSGCFRIYLRIHRMRIVVFEILQVGGWVMRSRGKSRKGVVSANHDVTCLQLDVSMKISPTPC